MHCQGGNHVPPVHLAHLRQIQDPVLVPHVQVAAMRRTLNQQNVYLALEEHIQMSG